MQKIVDNVKVKIDLNELLNRVMVEPGSDDGKRIEELVEEAGRIGKPKGYYKISKVEQKVEDGVIIDGIEFRSRILRVNLDSVDKVFPFIATCGNELEMWSRKFNDILETYWIDMIKESAFLCGYNALKALLQNEDYADSVCTMNPGSLEDWPMSAQTKLFELLGNPTDIIGVKLSDSFLMSPIKSVSGIWFPSQVKYENCQLCSRENCQNRRAPYNVELFNDKYKLGVVD